MSEYLTFGFIFKEEHNFSISIESLMNLRAVGILVTFCKHCSKELFFDADMGQQRTEALQHLTPSQQQPVFII